MFWRRVFVRAIREAFRRLPPQDELVAMECQRYLDRYRGENDTQIHSNGELHLMNKVLRNCRAVFDVGANVGEWATIALGINPTLELHCFEPCASTYQLLLENKFPDNVTCNKFGLGARPGEIALHLFEDYPGLNSLYKREGLENGWGLTPQRGTEIVNLTTLDDYCSKKAIREVDFLKVDVEGHELEVLRGGTELIAKSSIDIIQFEYGGCFIDARILLKDIFEFFQSHDYALFKVFPTELRKADRYDQRLENFQYSNWAAISFDRCNSLGIPC
jgi:FkbM family methyltransferase